MLNFFGKFSDLGLLIMRLGVGLSFLLIHGWGKMFGGPERWEGLGMAFANVVGFELFPVFFGFMAAASEFIGGILVAIGLLYRPACLLIGFTMLIAMLNHLIGGDSWGQTSHSLKMFFVFVGMLCVGPGKYSIDR